MGLEAVIPPGELIELGGALRKDVAGYDLKSLLVGSEGTLGIVTAAWLKLLPAPEAAYPIMAAFPDTAGGCEAIETVLGLGLDVAAVEYLDPMTLRHAGGSLPWGRPPGPAFAVIAEVDGAEATARQNRDELLNAWAESSLWIEATLDRREIEALWRWRDGVSLAVNSYRGGKISEDIVVPLDRLRDAIEGTLAIGAAHDLPACSWGHAGDGNLHSTFMIDPADHGQVQTAERAAEDLFRLAVELGGSLSGEHGLGLVKAGQLRRQWTPAAVRMHEEIKRAFDPKGLMNPGKKCA
jgi:FAD/FMN-containing dehydrogenase